jgi:hypothetical protein
MEELARSLLEVMRCIFNLLDNTFLGTLFAGSLLAHIGLYLYRNQKELDASYERKRRLEEAGAKLFSHIEIANKFYSGQLNANDNNQPQMKALNKLLNDKHGNYFETEAIDKANAFFKNVEQALNDFVAYLKVEGVKTDSDIEKLTSDVTTFGFYLLSTMTLSKSSQKEIDEYRKNSTELYENIKLKIQD